MYQPIAGYRITPLPINPDGSRATPKYWPCWRCGQTVKGHHHLIIDAPCRECRKILRDEYGDLTVWDPRRPVHPTTPARIIQPDHEFVESITVGRVGFWLDMAGVELHGPEVRGCAA